MIGFLVFVTLGWVFNISFSNSFEVLSQTQSYYKLLLLLSQVKGMLFIIIPLFSFIVYLEFFHIVKTGVSYVTNIIKSIKWQIITIIIMLVIMAFCGFLYMYLLESVAGGTP
jgi:hypothetical protein